MNKCFVISPKENARLGNTMFTHLYPENELSLKEQQKYKMNDNFDVITQSPFIIGGYWAKDVLIWNGKEFLKPTSETYGASYDSILIAILDFDYIISKEPFDRMKEVIKSENLDKLYFIANNFGQSFEKRFIYQEIAKLEE